MCVVCKHSLTYFHKMVYSNFLKTGKTIPGVRVRVPYRESYKGHQRRLALYAPRGSAHNYGYVQKGGGRSNRPSNRRKRSKSAEVA